MVMEKQLVILLTQMKGSLRFAPLGWRSPKLQKWSPSLARHFEVVVPRCLVHCVSIRLHRLDVWS